MDFVERLLQDNLILSKYEKCGKTNHYNARHDIVHVKNCLEISEKLLPIFGTNEREKLLIQTSLVFHDSEQALSRVGHEERAAKFAEEYLKNEGQFSESEIKTITSAILMHDEFENLNILDGDVSWLVNLIDKLDFSKKRLVSEISKFDNKRLIYADIEDVDFKLEENALKVVLRLSKSPNEFNEKELFRQNLFTKAMNVFQKFCKKKGLFPLLFAEDKKLNLDDINLSVMGDDGKLKNK